MSQEKAKEPHIVTAAVRYIKELEGHSDDEVWTSIGIAIHFAAISLQVDPQTLVYGAICAHNAVSSDPIATVGTKEAVFVPDSKELKVEFEIDPVKTEYLGQEEGDEAQRKEKR